MTGVSVIAATGLTPDVARSRFALAPTATVAEIVAEALPHATEAALAQVRVTLLKGDRCAVIPRARWRHVRPHAGTTVVIRAVPGAGAVGYIAKVLTAQFVNITGITSLGFLQGVYIASAGVAALGLGAIASYLVTSLIPLPQQPRQPGNPEDRYDLRGWRNEATPGDPVPLPMGKIRTAPVFAAQPYTEIVGGQQYVRAAFLLGYGQLDISDIRIGDTAIDDYTDVTYETREGTDSDDPLDLTPRQVIEDSQNIQLRRPPATDSAGNPTGGDVESPIVLHTASNATQASLVFHFPSGLFYIKDNGDIQVQYVSVRIRQRQTGGSWSTVETIDFGAATREAFFRQYTWELPSRGRWEIEVTRLTGDDYRPNTSRDIYLRALQSIRPEYPIALSKPLALIAVRIRASFQLNGTLDTVNALVQRYVPDWDGSSWTSGLTRNPASLYVYALQGNHAAYPVADAGIDWETIQDWHDYCATNGLKYDRGRFGSMGLAELLRDIARAGHAAPRHDGQKWSVVIDRAQEAVAHITPRDSRNFRATRTYIRPPDGLRARFRDEDNDYEDATRTIAWPGHTGDIDLVEEIPMPGKTDPAEVATELYRTAQETILRRDTFQVEQDGAARTVTRGDTVMLTHHALSDVQRSGRVRAVTDKLVILDEAVTMTAGSYAISWQLYDAGDTVGQTVVSPVLTVAGTRRALQVTGTDVPAVGDLVTFGPSDEVTEAVRVTGIEPGRDLWATIYMTNDAPELDTLAAAYTPPAWDPVIGDILESAETPDAPVFAGVSTEAAAGAFGDDSRTVTVQVAAAADDTAAIAEIVVEHRETAVGSYSSATVAGTSGSVDLTYDVGTVLDLRAAARNMEGTLGSYTSVINYTVGADAATLADAIDLSSASVTGGLGHALIALAISDTDTTQVQVFRTPNGDALDTGTDTLGSPITVPAGGALAFADGDTSRTDLLSAAWTAGSGWDSTSLPSAHTTTDTASLEQSVSTSDGETLRGEITISGRTAGSVTVSLTGGATSDTTAAISANAQTLFSLDAVTGSDTVEIIPTSDFDGTVDSVTLYLETPACVGQGSWDYRFAALNSDGVATAPSSAITTTII